MNTYVELQSYQLRSFTTDIERLEDHNEITLPLSKL